MSILSRLGSGVAVILPRVAMGTAMTSIALIAAAPGDAQDASLKSSFTRCSICHAVNGSGGKLGPDLTGVVGRKAGSVPGYAYSDAMKASKITWTPAEIEKFIAGPQAMVPGTKMTFAGISDPAQRAKVVAYLKSAKGK
jgi:cytochrome c